MSKNLYKKCCICKKYFKENDSFQGEINLKFLYYSEPSKVVLDMCGECLHKNFGELFDDEQFKEMIERDYGRDHNMRIDFFNR